MSTTCRPATGFGTIPGTTSRNVAELRQSGVEGSGCYIRGHRVPSWLVELRRHAQLQIVAQLKFPTEEAVAFVAASSSLPLIIPLNRRRFALYNGPHVSRGAGPLSKGASNASHGRARTGRHPRQQ